MDAQQNPDFCDSLTDEQDEAARQLLETVAAKWPMAVLYELVCAGGPVRFSRIRDRVDGISQKVLAQTLRTLESYRLITRKVYPEVPPRVEYQATSLGHKLQQQFVPVWAWIVEHLDDFQGVAIITPKVDDRADLEHSTSASELIARH